MLRRRRRGWHDKQVEREEGEEDVPIRRGGREGEKSTKRGGGTEGEEKGEGEMKRKRKGNVEGNRNVERIMI